MTEADKNKKKAREYFGITDNPNLVLHHINPEWKYTDIERYNQWNPEDLVVMTNEEHTKLHHKGKVLSEETKQKMSASHKGCKTWNKGKTGCFSEKTIRKLSESHLGKNNWIKGTHRVYNDDGTYKLVK